MNQMLPPGWTWVDVEALASSGGGLTDGPFGSNLKTAHYSERGPLVIRLQNIGEGTFLKGDAHIPQAHFERLRKHEAIAGDVVAAMLGTNLPRACLVPSHLGPAIVKADCVRLRVSPTVADARFVAAGLNSFSVRQQAERFLHGVGRPRLGLRWLRKLKFPLAPTAEQQRVVDALDSYLSRLDAAVANLERAQVRLKAYRASVLKAAVEGRLVPTEAELARAEKRDYEAASVLLERILTERRRHWEAGELARLKAAGKTPKDAKWKLRYQEPVAPEMTALPGLPTGWCWASLDQLAVLLRNGQSKPPREGVGVRTLRISSVRPLSVDFDDVRYLPGVSSDYEGDLVEIGDLLFTRYNGTPSLVGVCGRIRVLTEPTVHPDKLIKVRLCSLMSASYVELAVNTGESRRLVERRTRTTAGQAGISGADLRQMPVPLPPYGEQERIADELDALLSVAEAMAVAITRDLLRCARLRQSILKWAFEGKLVDPDPADEPAETLLARIRAERAATPPVKKQTRGKKVKAAS